MMNGAIFIGHTLEDDARSMGFPLYGAPSEDEGSPSLEFTWPHPNTDCQYSPRQALAKEPWVKLADVGHYVATNQDFNNGLGLDNHPADPELYTHERTMGPPVDGASPLGKADFISSQQSFGTEGYYPNSSEVTDMTPSDRSPASSPSARRTSSTTATTPMDSAGTIPELKEHRERNRVAARKCRQKAKQNFVGLQRREKELSQKNKALHSHVGCLRDEILDLKNEILRHSGCNSSVIQNYIANAARRQSG
ncbi:hypothetical protein F5B22DRAFT_417363 [Xylaria bambusicola]|uniref:uncharacterized protein n=1 Tax=Xylaria bambusicola TaxID=326684 RepID=UPI002007AA76|nr:uncharacterized protein F5B22DRAFT_417363 [Xylaria bambusicola]KAI0523789.1 hypothetical protein F5B22DRAFT_417363 [Xylaria bambusicola]